MKTHDLQVVSSLEISGSLEIPIVNSSESIPSGLKSGSIFFNKEDNLMYLASGSQNYVVGSQTTPPPPTQADIEYLVVAGGGGGGGGGWGAGGGGAGGMLSSSLSSIESGSSITVTIGGGGTGRGGGNTFTSGGDGEASSIASSTGTTFTTITSTGGGGGGAENANSGQGRDGGSGGGATTGTGTQGGSSTVGQGNDGGDAGTISAPGYPGAGGGGKGSVGQESSGNNGGDGGTGQASSITGTSTNYAGGGGGGTRTSGAQGTGGSSVGGDGANGTTAATAATANRGGGGGGAAGNAAADGTNGGSGVVILAYPSSSINAAGGIVGDAGNGRKYHQFNESGTLKVGSTSDFGTVTDSLALHLDAGNFASRGTSTWTDLSGNSRNGTVNNATLGNNFYYTLNGSTSTNIVGSASGISGNSARTVEAWYKLSNTDDIIINLGNQSFSGNTEWSLAPNGTTLNVYGGVGAYDESMTGFSTSLTSGNWTHLVVTWDANNPGTLKGYVNGTLEVTLARSSGEAYSTDNGYEIGGWSNNDRPYNGDIAQIRVYSDVLSAAEVLQNYNATKTNFV